MHSKRLLLDGLVNGCSQITNNKNKTNDIILGYGFRMMPKQQNIFHKPHKNISDKTNNFHNFAVA